MSFPFTPLPVGVLSLYANLGFITGGVNASSVTQSISEAITFATDTRSLAPSAALSATRFGHNGDGNTSKGMLHGGAQQNTPSVVYNNNGTRIVYSTQVAAAITSLSLGLSEAGYSCVGNNTLTIAQESGYARKTPFATETTVTSTATLATSRAELDGFGKKDKAFIGGGFPGGVGTRSAATDRLTFATETSANVAGAALSVARLYLSATGNNLAAYIVGGLNASNAHVATVDKIPFATETRSTPAGAQLPTGVRSPGSVGNNVKGFVCGGTGAAIQANSYRINFATDTTSAVASANLSVAREFCAGV